MAYVITPQSELEAVNEILSSIGSNPVDSLENSLDVDVLNAKRILSSVSREYNLGDGSLTPKITLRYFLMLMTD